MFQLGGFLNQIFDNHTFDSATLALDEHHKLVIEGNENPMSVISRIGKQFEQFLPAEQHVGDESPPVVIATVHDDVAHWRLQVEWHMICRSQRMTLCSSMRHELIQCRCS